MKIVPDRISLPDNFEDILKTMHTPNNDYFWESHKKELAIIKEMVSRKFGPTQISNALFKFGYKISRYQIEKKVKEMEVCGKK